MKEFPNYVFTQKFDSILVFDTFMIVNSNEHFFESLSDFLVKINERYLYIDNVLPFSYTSSTPLSSEEIKVKKFNYKFDVKENINESQIREELLLPDGSEYFSIASHCLISGDNPEWGIYFSMASDLILIGLNKEIEKVFNSHCMNKEVFQGYFVKEEFYKNLIFDKTILKRFKENYF